MEILTDKWTKNRRTNGRNYTNFKSNLAVMVMYLSVKFEFDWTKRLCELESGNKNLNEQTDRHINLIGWLVTHNPPKNKFTRVFKE